MAKARSARTAKKGSVREERQARMLRAAVDIFFAQGYRASMATIADKAQVARQTVYAHFGSKERLFEYVVRSLASDVTVVLAESGVGLRESLINFAMALRERILAPRAIGVYRTLVAEAPRFPKLARLVYATGQEAAQRALANILRARMSKHQAEFAAQMFMSMVFGYERARLLYGVRTAKLLDRPRAEQIVDCFLRAFSLEQAKQRHTKQ